MKKQVFSVILRIVFLIAFGAFLWASLHHIATFFHAFEPANSDESGSYALAFAIDGTALVLTTGMMFFEEEMPTYARWIVWMFILFLTGFSWVVNWEYAMMYQASDLTKNLDPIWETINPILASSFAVLNVAYTEVSKFFGSKQKTMEQLRAELDALSGRAALEKQIKDAKGPGIIAIAKEKALEVKNAASEVLASDKPVDTIVDTSSVKNDSTSGQTSGQKLSTPSEQNVSADLSDDMFLASGHISGHQSGQSNGQNFFTGMDTILDTPEDTLVDTSAKESVFSEQTKPRRITVDLSGHSRDTDPLKSVDKNVRSARPASIANGSAEAAKRVTRILRRNPDIKPGELADKAKVSRSYASQIRSQFLAEKPA